MRLLCYILFLIVWSYNLIGQVDVAISFEQDTVVIGDEVTFTLSLESSADVDIVAVPKYFLDSIYGALQSVKAYRDTTQPIKPVLADFELVSSGDWEDRDVNGIFTADEMIWKESQVGGKLLRQSSFTVQLWDPGENIVVYPTIIYSLSGQQDQILAEQSATVFVAPPGDLPAIQDSIDVAPIKNIKKKKANLSDFLFYIILIGFAILLGLVYWLYIKYVQNQERKSVLYEEAEVIIPPHIVAHEKLENLRDLMLWQKGKVKQYQSELTYIIREYLEGRYEISALESTTEEIVRDLINESVEGGNILSVKRILQVADLVKFAKAIPEENIHEQFMDEAVDLINRTKVSLIPEDD